MGNNVFVNGFGTIGSRLAHWIQCDSQLNLIGIGKYSVPDLKTERGRTIAQRMKRGNVFVPDKSIEMFEQANYNVAGTIEEALEKSDVIIDASDNKGYENMQEFYSNLNVPVIFQGGEARSGPKKISNITYNVLYNFDEARRMQYIRQGSCNVTGALRVLGTIWKSYCGNINEIDLSLLRRSMDLENLKEMKDTVSLTTDPHHSEDILDIVPKMPLYLEVVKVPSRQQHLHLAKIRFSDKLVSISEIIELLDGQFGVAVLPNSIDTKSVRDFATERYPFGDTNMAHVHIAGIKKDRDLKIYGEGRIFLQYSVDQTGIIIPDVLALVHGILHNRNQEEALNYVDGLMDLSTKKEELKANL